MIKHEKLPPLEQSSFNKRNTSFFGMGIILLALGVVTYNTLTREPKKDEIVTKIYLEQRNRFVRVHKLDEDIQELVKLKESGRWGPVQEKALAEMIFDKQSEASHYNLVAEATDYYFSDERNLSEGFMEKLPERLPRYSRLQVVSMIGKE